MNTLKPKWNRVALECEAATLHAINEINHGDSKSQATASLLWDDAQAELKALTAVEYNHASLFLNERGRLDPEMLNIIWAAVQRFVDEVDKCQAGQVRH